MLFGAHVEIQIRPSVRGAAIYARDSVRVFTVSEDDRMDNSLIIQIAQNESGKAPLQL